MQAQTRLQSSGRGGNLVTPHPPTPRDIDTSTGSSQSPRLPRLVSTVTETDLDRHWEYLKSQRLDPTLLPPEYDETGIVARDLTEDIIDIRGMFDPRIHLPSAPVGWKGFEDATPLSKELIAYIAVRGRPLTVADFMRQALTHPKHGYYTNPTKPDTVAFHGSRAATTPSNEDLWDPHITADTTPDNFIIGKQGDFVTAPDVSQIFGECLAVCFITQY